MLDEHIACNDHIYAIEKKLAKNIGLLEQGSFLIMNHLGLYNSHISIPI